MLSRYASALRILTIVLIVAIVGVAGLLVRFVVVNSLSDTPRTELERAILAAEEAVRANPEDPTARIKLASAYIERGAIAAAREQVDIAVRLDPENPAVYYVLGLAQERDGDTAEAIKTLTKAAAMEGQLAGFYADVYAALARLYEDEGQTDGAIDAINSALNNGPENTVLLFARGQIYERSGKRADAYYDYALVLDYVPDHAEAKEGLERIARDDPKAVDDARKRFQMETSSTATVE